MKWIWHTWAVTSEGCSYETYLQHCWCIKMVLGGHLIICSSSSSSSSSFYSSVALQCTADVCLRNRLLPVSSVFWPLFPVCNLAFINVCWYTIPHLFFGHPFGCLNLRIIVKYLTYFSFTVHSVNVTNPIQLTYSDKWKYVWTSKQLC